jgi:hypothetical protein
MQVNYELISNWTYIYGSRLVPCVTKFFGHGHDDLAMVTVTVVTIVTVTVTVSHEKFSWFMTAFFKQYILLTKVRNINSIGSMRQEYIACENKEGKNF